MTPELNRVLMIAFHYPPCSGSSGVHRSLKFSRYLLDAGWQAIVLTAHPRAYERIGEQQLREIPAAVIVRRTFALDVSRHLSVKGIFPRFIALPDRWSSWWVSAIPAGLRLIRRHRPRVIWSTYPIATAHLIGLTLHRLSGLPWVVDFRDPMIEDDYPRDPVQRRIWGWIERQSVEHASQLVFVSESAMELCLKRYPSLERSRCLLIPNGYDEQDFAGLVGPEPPRDALDRPVRLVHAGVIYQEERDPRPLFRSLSRLKRGGHVGARNLRIHLRAAGSDIHYGSLLRELAIDDIVHLLPPIPYREVLQECLDADALLLLQGAACNQQIPAKTYEYLRAGRPILALTPDAGDTAELLRRTGGASIVDLADEAAIGATLLRFMSQLRAGTHPLPSTKQVTPYARDQQAAVLAGALTRIARR